MREDIVPMVWEAIGGGRITTREASERLESIFGYRCPDDIAKTLTRLRREGLVKGEVSMEAGGWVWWADEECRAKRNRGDDDSFSG